MKKSTSFLIDSISIKIEPETKAALKRMAENHKMSFSLFTRNILRGYAGTHKSIL